MKAKRIGKKSVQITMTLTQLDSVFAALDSCSDCGTSGIYSDIPKTDNALLKATRKAGIE